MRYLLFFLPLSLLLLVGCHSTKSTTSATKKSKHNFAVNFASSDMLMPALEKAKAQNKLVFLDIYTDWCLPCQMMEEEVFTNNEIGNFLNKNFINLKVDAEKGNGPTLATVFEVYAYPTLLFLDADGNIIVRKEGAAFHAELKKLGENALASAN